LSQAGTTEINALLQLAVEQGTVPGVVAIVANKNQILYHAAFGLQDVGKRKEMAKDSIFRIASMTKPVTSVAVMMLQDEGKLRVDDPVSKYLPAYKDREVIATYDEKEATYTTRKSSREILIRHLLTKHVRFRLWILKHHRVPAAGEDRQTTRRIRFFCTTRARVGPTQAARRSSGRWLRR